MRGFLLLSILLIAAMLLTGSLTQEYVQTVDSSGSSYVEETRDLSVVLQLFPEGTIGQISQACVSNPALGCSVSGTSVTTRIYLSPDSGYCSVSTEYGLPFTTTTLTVNKLPNDRFDEAFLNLLTAAGLPSGKSRAVSIDLRDKENNAVKAAAFKDAGIGLTYAAVMPNGYTETVDLVELLADSSPIVVRTQELNVWLISLIAGVLVLGAFALSFFQKKKKKR